MKENKKIEAYMIKNFLILSFLALALVPANAQTAIEGGTVTQHVAKFNVPVYRVHISSDDAELADMAKRAFNLHGSYKQVPAGNAQFVFNFSPQGANAVKLTIRGGSVYEQVCAGSTKTQALLKACDAAVARTLRTPGFFAGTIAFSIVRGEGKSEICTSDIIFKNVRKLTNDNSDSLMPHFSPDGKKIMYTGYYKSGFMDLFEIDISSNTRRTFAAYKGSNTGGSFSPDGSKVAMILTSSGNAEVWTASSNGTNFRRMTKTSATESSASFSPDGSKLIFASDSRGGPQIYTMPSAGGKMQIVPTRISRYCSEPIWNKANPNLIAFTAAVGKGFQVAVYDFSERNSRWITSGASSAGAVWLNDGRHLICTKTEGKKTRLYVVDSETNSQKPLHTSAFGSTKEADFVYNPR